jgi:ribosomal silencing factor RsfS
VQRCKNIFKKNGKKHIFYSSDNELEEIKNNNWVVIDPGKKNIIIHER